MLFVSWQYALFLPAAFAIHWFLFNRSARLQNICLIAASCLFYGWWNWRFLALIGFNTVSDYLIGLQLARTSDGRTRKLLLGASLAINLVLLGFFKYFNFFVSSLDVALSAYQINLEVQTLRIIMPLAISYYTLQTMGYSIDVYQRKIEPTRDFTAFCAYILFFPKLLAGPIERAGRCLPQFARRRAFDHDGAVDGLRQMLWGLFKKVAIADACAGPVNMIFAGAGAQGGSTLAMGAILYAFQIYADFSGYSDMAIGAARLFGIGLAPNFNYPYFSRNMADFWRRWHISLSTWLRDYLFLPLSYALARRLGRERYWGIRADRVIGLIATPATFLVCGLWHGASFTYLAWGLWHGLMLMPQVLRWGRKRPGKTAWRPPWPQALKAFLEAAATFALVSVGWIIFRADNIYAALAYLRGIFSTSLLAAPAIAANTGTAMAAILAVTMVEWLQRGRRHGLDINGYAIPRAVRWLGYTVLVALIMLMPDQRQGFIYFQF